jgi:S-adenosylmethionine decarboxylase
MIGNHWIADFAGCDSALLKDEAALNDIFTRAIAASNATILSSVSHRFGGHGGVTGLFLLAESHAAYHTYPELNYIALDFFTCGSCDPRKSGEYVTGALSPGATSINHLTRELPRRSPRLLIGQQI